MLPILDFEIAIFILEFISFIPFIYGSCILSLAPEIGHAYAVLSNPEKRKQYDLTGSEEQTCSHPSNGRFNFHRGCEADITPEDLFNMFFGGAFPTGIGITIGIQWGCTEQHQSL